MSLNQYFWLLLLACPGAAFADHELDNRDLGSGAVLYADFCGGCHGANLEGQPNWRIPDEDGRFPAPPHDETGHTWHHDNQFLFDYTALGGAVFRARAGIQIESGMPAFGETLSEDEIWDVLAFIRTTWPQRIQDNQAARNPRH